MGKLFRIWRNKVTGELYGERKDYNCEPVGLVYDKVTKVVYYKFTETVDLSFYTDECETKVGYMAPYINENGKYCRFINHQIVEIG